MQKNENFDEGLREYGRKLKFQVAKTLLIFKYSLKNGCHCDYLK